MKQMIILTCLKMCEATLFTSTEMIFLLKLWDIKFNNWTKICLSDLKRSSLINTSVFYETSDNSNMFQMCEPTLFTSSEK